MLKKSVLFSLFLCLFAVTGSGQETAPIKSTLTPKVIATVYQRSNGEIIGYLPDSIVTLYQNDTPLEEGVTDEHGSFFTEDLKPGNYSIVIDNEKIDFSEEFDLALTYEWNPETGRYEAYIDIIVDVQALDTSVVSPVAEMTTTPTNPSPMSSSMGGVGGGMSPALTAGLIGGALTGMILGITADDNPESPARPRYDYDLDY